MSNQTSLVSVGTERYQLDLARKGLLGKALARPDLVRQVVDKARTEGIMEAWQQASQRLDVPVSLGYSSAGVVIGLGDGVTGFAVGDRVACTGAGYASHAEVVSVPALLCTPLPTNVSAESASFAAVGGVALEAVRMAHAQLGDRIAVIGLGLIGQIAVQLLRAAGCHVLGVDPVASRADEARRAGASEVAISSDEAERVARTLSSGEGVDACIVLAATESNAPLELAATLTRERGRIVAAGLVGLNVPRKPFFDKELELVVSRAWGPGLFDDSYVEQSRDYPYAYARWTAGRNLSAFIEQVSAGSVNVERLVTHRFTIDDAPAAYDLISTGREPFLGVVLTYPGSAEARTVSRVELGLDRRGPAAGAERHRQPAAPAAAGRKPGLALVGAGLFARTTLLPALKSQLRRVDLRGIVTAGGISAAHSGERYGFQYVTTRVEEVLDDPSVTCVVIATRHNSHADLAGAALRAGKAVLVEKPLAISASDLDGLVATWREVFNSTGVPPRLMVGFNRRYAEQTERLRGWLRDVSSPVMVTCRVNAGPVPKDSWVHDALEGGGRIVGEVCHFVDLAQCLSDSLTTRAFAESVSSSEYGPDENVVVSLRMANGSTASICYAADGSKSFPRERVEVFGGGGVGVIDNFRSLTLVRGRQRHATRRWNIDRGYVRELEAFISMAQGGEPPVSFADNVATTQATFAIEESLVSGSPVEVKLPQGLGELR